MPDIPRESKWTDIELLPEWEEEFYDVYTARKYGKWVMLKTLKEQYRNDPRFEMMIEKEFDARYNLAHPNIIMINDFEDVPGVGRSIITDDVYGKSLRKLIDTNELTSTHLDKVVHNLVDAIDYIQANHIAHFPIRPETIIFTQNIENLKLIDVGYDRTDHLTQASAKDDIRSFGRVLSEVLDHIPDAPAHLRRVADRSASGGYDSVHKLRLALQQRTERKFFLTIIIFLLVMIALLIWLTSPLAPAHHAAGI